MGVAGGGGGLGWGNEGVKIHQMNRRNHHVLDIVIVLNLVGQSKTPRVETVDRLDDRGRYLANVL